MFPERAFGHLRPPQASQVAEYAATLGWNLSEDELSSYTEQIAGSLLSLDRVEELDEPTVELKHPYRDPGRPPRAGEDPFNAWIRRCEVRGAAEGPLAGRTLGVKDCIAVAGVPTTNGGRRLPVLVPTEDAVVIERLLDAGVTVTGKTNLEDSGYGLGEGSYFGAARNPVDPSRSTGGSSTGSGAAVAAGEVDLALGADEGGSVRIPAAWCGIVGMKATHGLVPSYGMTYMDHTLDHIGPMTRSVADNALMLEIMGGPDWRDPQWVPQGGPGHPGPGTYTGTAARGVAGLKIGIIAESLEPVGCTTDVLDAFNASAKTLTGLGAEVSTVSVPLWSDGWAVASGALAAGASAMANSFGTANFGHLGRIDPQAVATLAAQARLQGDDLPPMLRLMMLTVAHVQRHYYGMPFVKAHNLRLEMRRQVDAALDGIDLLITPTVPTVSHVLLDHRARAAELSDGRVGVATANTAPLDLTGHPGLSVPAGTGEGGLPIGLQIIGRHFAEDLVYQVGFAIEGA